MNIVIIVCDTLRFDHVGCYGYFRDTTPNIDSAARKGIVFEDFYVAGAPTGPSFTCLYTGLHTLHHKFYQFGLPNIRQIDDTIFTIPEILRSCGYVTAAIDNLNSFPAHSKHYVRGYTYYINPNPYAFFPPIRLTADHVNRRIIPWITNHSDEKFFLFAHYWDPHMPYNQPKDYREVFHHKKGKISDLEVRYSPRGYKYVPGWGKVGEYSDGVIDFRGKKVSIDLYDGEIRYMDNAIGEIISKLESEDILDETMIIITSDHGEQLGQHGFWEHDILHDTVAHVPLIIRYPKKLPKGKKVEGFCQHIDLLPTILDLIGVEFEFLDLDGKSIVPLFRGEKIRNHIFMEFSSGQRAVRTEVSKLIDYNLKGNPARELEFYKVMDDPMESSNVMKVNKKTAHNLGKMLSDWIGINLGREKEDPALYRDQDLRMLRDNYLDYRKKMKDLTLSIKNSYIKPESRCERTSG